MVFQSTLPMRGETSRTRRRYDGDDDFNPLSPCGERLVGVIFMYAKVEFQSTLPMRGETKIKRF